MKVESEKPIEAYSVYRVVNGESLLLFEGGLVGKIMAKIAAAAFRFNYQNVRVRRLGYGDSYGIREGDRVRTYNLAMNDGELGSDYIPAIDRLTTDPRVWLD